MRHGRGSAVRDVVLFLFLWGTVGFSVGTALLLGPVRWIAVCYLGFGLSAYVLRGFEPHFLLFVGTGVLAGIPAFLLRKPK